VDANIVILHALNVGDIAVIVNEFTLLLQDKSLKELCQDSVRHEELDAATI
jgi:hypothetical protein